MKTKISLFAFGLFFVVGLGTSFGEYNANIKVRWSSKNGQLIKPLFLIAVFPQILSD